jgi:hypothetical protein
MPNVIAIVSGEPGRNSISFWEESEVKREERGKAEPQGLAALKRTQPNLSLERKWLNFLPIVAGPPSPSVLR